MATNSFVILLYLYIVHLTSFFTFCAAYLLYSTSSAINRVELDGSQRTTVTSSGTRGVRAHDFDIR